MHEKKKKVIALTIAFICLLNIAIIVSISSFTVSYFIPKKLTIEQKIEDFDYMYKVLKECYPYFEVKKRMFGYDWLTHKDEFRNWIRDTKNDVEYYKVLNRIVMLMQSGHTHVLDVGNFDYFKNVYEDPHLAYSPSRRKILNNPVSLKTYERWRTVYEGSESQIPLLFKYIEGKYVAVDGNLSSNDIPIGAVLVKVNGVDTDVFIKSMGDMQYLEYDYKRQKQIINDLIIYTGKDKSANLLFLTPEGATIEKVVKRASFNTWVSDEEEKNYRVEILKKDRVAYVQLKSMDVMDRSEITEHSEAVRGFLEEVKDYPYLIVDIRGNQGGNTAYWRSLLASSLLEKQTTIDTYVAYRKNDYLKPFLEDRFNETAKSTRELPANKNYPPELDADFGYFFRDTNEVLPFNPIKFNGKIYLLVDNYVYSAAEEFACFAKASGWATLVGTTTGGDGIGADAAFLSLPNSGFIVRFASGMGINPDGTANEETHTKPDIFVEQSYEAYLKYLQIPKEERNAHREYDTVLNYVLNLTIDAELRK